MKAAHAVAGWWGVQLKSAWGKVGADDAALSLDILRKILKFSLKPKKSPHTPGYTGSNSRPLGASRRDQKLHHGGPPPSPPF